MFFKIAHAPDLRFPAHHQLGDLVISVDAGWQILEHNEMLYLYKGYAESTTWTTEFLENLKDHEDLGNFCVFKFCSARGELSLMTNRWRGIVIWNSPGEWISNLDKGSYTIWNDSSITIRQDLDFDEFKLDVIGDVPLDILDESQITQHIDTRLDRRISDFLLNNQLPLRVFCSGGIDSTLVWSYIQRHTMQFELVLENRIQWDYFWCQNKKHITNNFWAYRQIHHWLEPCVLSSGAPGDEFFLRSPTTVNLWLMYNDIDIFDILQPKSGLHYDYYALPKHQELFRSQHSDPSLAQIMRLDRANFVKYLCNIVLNDCQHWHLGNTLTFTPLRDLEIFKMFFALSLDDLIPQILNSGISRKLIAKNNPSLLDVLSPVKNVQESLKNLSNLVPR